MRRTRVALLVAALSAATAAGPGRAEGAGPTITDHVVTSFDGTPLEVTLMLPPGATSDAPVPLVLRGHGFGEHRQRTPDGSSAALPLVEAAWGDMITPLLDAGYAVLTWDARGFGCSGGEAQLDDPTVEGSDVSALLDWAAAEAPVLLDGPGDPVVGMVGESYGGGVQTAAASRDPRIDAIVPTASWASLGEALFPGEVTKPFFSLFVGGLGIAIGTLEGVGTGCPSGTHLGGVGPELATTTAGLLLTEELSDAASAWLAARSLTGYGREHPVAIPTMVIQGSTDTLFPLRQGVGLFEHVRALGAPAKLVTTCGGHGTCPASYRGDTDFAHVFELIVQWFDRHLRRDPSVDTGPAVEYHTNDGQWKGVEALPSPAAGLAATGRGSLVNLPLDVLDPLPFLRRLVVDQVVDSAVVPFIAAQRSRPGDPRAFTFEIAAAGDEPLDLVGLPQIRLTVSGTGGPRVHLFAKLVDREASEIVNLQEGAVRAAVGPEPTTVDVPMPGVSYTLAAGHHLDLQLATNSSLHATARPPSLTDVTVLAAVPVVRRAAAPAAVAPDRAQAAAPSPDAVAGGGGPGLPATGGRQTSLGAALLALLAGIAALRRTRAVARR